MNSGDQLAPFVTEQIEGGVKADFGGFGGSAAVFEIKEPQDIVEPLSNTLTRDGEIRNRGLEINVFGEVLEGLKLLGGVTFMDGEQTRTEGGESDGNDAVGIPEVQFNLYGEYALPGLLRGTSLTGRLIHTGDQFVDAENNQSIPDWTRLDLGARYGVVVANTQFTLRFSLLNVFNEDYWSSAARGSLSYGVPRTFLLSTSASF